MVCRMVNMKVNVDKCGVMHMRKKEDGAEICHKWRIGAECGRVQVPGLRD